MAATIETTTVPSSGAERPTPYYSIKKDATKEEKDSTEIPIPEYEDDVSEPEVYGAAFENEEKRIAFMQKIFTIKLIQAFSVTLVMVIFVSCPYPSITYDPFIRIHLIVVSSLILTAVLGPFHYCTRKRFIAPYSYMFLVAYPLAFGFFISVIFFGWGLVDFFVSWVQFNFILFSLLVNSVLALHTKIEFKKETALMMAGIILIISYACTAPIIYEVSAFGVLYCHMMIFALSAYVIYDLEAMMSKPYRIHLSPADFIKAALIMHIDHRYMIEKFYQKHFQGRQSLDSHLNAAE